MTRNGDEQEQRWFTGPPSLVLFLITYSHFWHPGPYPAEHSISSACSQLLTWLCLFWFHQCLRTWQQHAVGNHTGTQLSVINVKLVYSKLQQDIISKPGDTSGWRWSTGAGKQTRRPPGPCCGEFSHIQPTAQRHRHWKMFELFINSKILNRVISSTPEIVFYALKGNLRIICFWVNQDCHMHNSQI